MRSSAAIIVAGLFCLGITGNAEGEGRIVFSEESGDLGQMLSGEKAEYRFRFQNQGEGNLIIEEVKTFCGCTAVTLSEKEIQPGEKGEIDVVFDSLGFEGQVKKRIEVYSSDPDRSLVVLELKAQVEPTVEVSPRDVDFGVIQVEKTLASDLERFISVKDLVNAGLKVTKLEPDLPFSRARVERVDGNETIIKVWIVPDDFRGEFQGWLKILTSSRFYPVIFTIIRGEVRE